MISREVRYHEVTVKILVPLRDADREIVDLPNEDKYVEELDRDRLHRFIATNIKDLIEDALCERAHNLQESVTALVDSVKVE